MLDDGTTLAQAQGWLRQRVEQGANCPCCGRFTKVYNRKINAGMAMSLFLIYKKAGLDWLYLPANIPATSREEGKLRYWGLLFEDKTRSGWWRVSPLGEEFIRKGVCVRKYARVYDGRCLSTFGPLVNFKQCLGTRFNYRELMAGL